MSNKNETKASTQMTGRRQSDGPNQGSHAYDDIIHLPHHVSDKHPHMDLIDRAAQFSPFAALTGHSAAIEETARLAEERMEINENEGICE